MITATPVTFVLASSIALLLVFNTWSARLVVTKSILTFLALATLCTWWFINRLSGDGLNYATLYHLRTGLHGAGIADFSHEIVSLLLSYIGALAVATSVALLAKHKTHPTRANTTPYLLAFGMFMVTNPITVDIYKLRQWSQVVASNKVSAEYRIISGNTDLRGKNIVLIYGESLERTYLDESKFPGLMPNIKRLAEESVDFTNISQSQGTGWTIAGLVASMCGVPLTVWNQDDANHLDRLGKFLPGARCIPDNLSDMGYRTEFIGGADATFAGKSGFLTYHGFTTVRDLSYFRQLSSKASDFSSWGAHDDILLKEAYSRFEELSRGKSPFLLTTLTLDTHHPSGHVPSECGQHTYTGLDQNYPILDAVSCSDKLIGQFIDKIRHSPYGKNTVIMLASDHLAMPNDARELLGSSGKTRRNLLLIMNSGAPARQVNTPMTTLDTGSTLLSMIAGKPVAVGFRRPGIYPANDGLTHALTSGIDVRPYHSYGQSLWMLGVDPRISITQHGEVKIGDQKMSPPLTFSIGDNGAVSGVFFIGAGKGLNSLPSGTGYIDYCSAFHAAPASSWCLLAANKQGQQALFGEDQLRRGVNLSDKSIFNNDRAYKITHNFIVQRGFPENYPYLIRGVASNGSIFSDLSEGVLFNGPFAQLAPGDYRVIIKGTADAPKSSWADVISNQGERVYARQVLQSSQGIRPIFDQVVHLPEPVDNLEIRVYAGAGEPVRVDGFELVPVDHSGSTTEI